ncbi:Glutathionylspermidine synthase [Vibrio xiamenensis]|uniref:Glutathionylspermidine synthase n=1 Tax=Vibrio xiamenensis TaxID=861298 RepID=A0A1G8A0Z0_9VIBR|nr:glutathionylspermidine synthase family protein [Vibrio xiamenensis]SDH14487.1 Glutathionylspermidine synthase [Vibrio xiamenensis]
MFLRDIEPRDKWQDRVCRLGFDFFEVSQKYPYWVDDRYFQFDMGQVDQVDKASEALHDMSIKAVQHVIENDMLDKFGVPVQYHQLIKHSWRTDKSYLYGRFDLAWDGKHPPKLLEYNAQTPTSLFEASVVAWDWLECNVSRGLLPSYTDQFNILDEQLILQFKTLLVEKQPETPILHFIVSEESEEDLRTVKYLAACADEAGWESIWLDTGDIQLTEDQRFADHESKLITTAFWLYPYEFALLDEYAQYIEHAGMKFIEPLWKVLLSSKALLPVLWQLYPGHENLLPCYFSDDPKVCLIKDKVTKPIYSREGANISIVFAGEDIEISDGCYGAEGFVTQQYWPLAKFQYGRCVIGSWMVGRVGSGISVRESYSRITDDVARFIPHVII